MLHHQLPRPEQQHSSEIQRRLCAVTCGFCQLPQLHTVKNETASQHIIHQQFQTHIYIGWHSQKTMGSHKILSFHTKGCIYMRMLLMIAINRTTFIPEPTQITICLENYFKLPATEIVDIFGHRGLQGESHLTRVWVEGRSVENDFRLCLQRNALLARQCMYYIVYQPMHCNVCSVICSITFPANQAMYICSRLASEAYWQMSQCRFTLWDLARLQDYLI